MNRVKAKFDVSGRVTCVTGASSGFGRSAAETLAAAGAKVVGVARRADVLENCADTLGSSASVVAPDLSRREEIEHTAARIAELCGAPDTVVHAEAISTREAADDVMPKGWDVTMTLNLATTFFLTQAFVPRMNAKRRGRVGTFTSVQAKRASSGSVAYGASTAGVAHLTRSMAEAWSRGEINANAIGADVFSTELTAQAASDLTHPTLNAEQTCVGRNGALMDIDGPLLFLCSDASAYMTGQDLMVDGVYIAK